MSNLLNEITEHFMTSKMGARPLKGYADTNLSITLKNQEYYGVGVLNIHNIQVNESFANVRLESKVFNIDGDENSFLVLSSTLYEYRQNFASLCANFVDLGKNNYNRESITKEPFQWWEKWKNLLGNVKSNKNPYAILGELWLYKREIEEGHKRVTWEGPKAKNHDIEGDKYHIEVKSSISQFKNNVTISNQFQLDGEKPLYLVLLKMQESSDGISINQIVEDLVSLDVNREDLEVALGVHNMPLGSGIREKKYRILEGRKYLVDSNFPIINAKSFVGGKIPKHIQKFTYTVELSSFDYDTIEIN